MQRVQKAQAAVANQKQSTAALKAKLERLRATCEYRNDADTVPTADSLAPQQRTPTRRRRGGRRPRELERARRRLLGPLHAAAALAAVDCVRPNGARCAAPGSGPALCADITARSAAICEVSSSMMPAAASSLISSRDFAGRHVVRGAPGVLRARRSDSMAFALGLACLQVQRQRLLVAHRLERGDVVVQIAKIGAVRRCARRAVSAAMAAIGFRSPSTLKLAGSM